MRYAVAGLVALALIGAFFLLAPSARQPDADPDPPSAPEAADAPDDQVEPSAAPAGASEAGASEVESPDAAEDAGPDPGPGPAAEESADPSEAAGREPDGECEVSTGPGRRAIGWLTFYSDGIVETGEAVGDTFVMVNKLYIDVSEDDGEVAGSINFAYFDSTDTFSIGANFYPPLRNGTVAFDPVTGKVDGEISLSVGVNTDPPGSVVVPITAEFFDDGTVTGVLDHPDLDLRFTADWVERPWAYSDDPDCREPGEQPVTGG